MPFVLHPRRCSFYDKLKQLFTKTKQPGPASTEYFEPRDLLGNADPSVGRAFQAYS
jgi:hypothetical protein